MKPQTEAPFSGLNQSDQETDEQWVSKSQLKRESHALQDLGKKLSQLNPEQLQQIPLNDQLLEAIKLAQKLGNKRGALKRHFQYIGKLLRSMDAQLIIDAVEKIEQNHRHSIQAFKNLEQWRERILQEGDEAIQMFCQQHTQADRQQLRQQWRNYQQAKDDAGRTRYSRQLFKTLRDSMNP
jgi:ribosome-associated protein